MRWLLLGAPAAMLIAWAMAGCGKWPDRHHGGCDICPQPFQYPAFDTPQHAILNLKYAWERRDSVRTRLVYDDAYQGTSTDSDHSTLTFTKDQEVGVVWSMGKDQNIVSIHFTTPPETTWVRQHYASDPDGWAAIQIPGVTVQVDDAVQGTLIASGMALFQFKLVPTLDSSSPTDTTWKVIRWTEVKN
ncbi:MAG TPA: hypothetical protein VL503_02855 [Candidatus Omnitrophota bacterium]|jgi:hypothetical protein|nr:hypothetical protein [Candidatus Omnitrophota bacterium]